MTAIACSQRTLLARAAPRELFSALRGGVELLAYLDLHIAVSPNSSAFNGDPVGLSHGIRGSNPDMRVIAHAFDLAAIGIGPNEESAILYHEPYRRWDNLSVPLDGFKSYVLFILKLLQLAIFSHVVPLSLPSSRTLAIPSTKYIEPSYPRSNWWEAP